MKSDGILRKVIKSVEKKQEKIRIVKDCRKSLISRKYTRN